MFLTNAQEVTTMSEALLNTGIGMGTVFLVLILISFIIYLLKFVPRLFEGKKKEEKPAAPAKTEPVKEAAVAQTAVAASDDAQLVAVIAAAIAASMTEETGVPVAPDGLVIRSIKKRTFSM